VNGKENYAKKLLGHAKGLFDFAEKCQGSYTSSITDAGSFYKYVRPKQ